jgi:predicted outer membrane repeat protein
MGRRGGSGRGKRALRSSLLLAAACTLGLGMLEVAGSPPAGAASGADYVVNSSASGPGTSGACAAASDGCTLAQAVTDYDNGTSGSDTISFSSSLDAETITLSTTLDLDNTSVALTIAGNGASETTISGGESVEPFDIPAGTAEVTIENLTIEDGSNVSNGGAIENDGTLTVTGSTFSANMAGSGGGGIENGDEGTGVLTLTDDTFSGNSSGSNGGAIENDGTLTVTASNFSDNTSANGGAIGNASGFTETGTVTASTFSGNTAAGNGGAIDNGDEGTGVLTVTASIFSGNSSGFNGGAIDNGDYSGTGTTTVTTSTFSGNSASNHGGAIDNGDQLGNGTLIVTASTFSEDSAPASGTTGSGHGQTIDSGDVDGIGTVTVGADIFAGGSACDQNSSTWSDEGYNVGTDTSCFNAGTGDATSSSLASELGTLADNGGPTETIEPLQGNPAVGLIPNPTTGSCPVAADQRGIASPSGSACNSGAVQSSFTTTLDGSSLSATIDAGEHAVLGASGLPSGATGTVAFSATTPDTTLCSFSYPSVTSCPTSSALGPGVYSGITATFTDSDGNYTGSTSTNTLSLDVDQAPSITAASLLELTVSKAATSNVTTTGYPEASLSLTGRLPRGMQFTDHGDGTATVAGIPAIGTAGSYRIGLDATNAAGSATRTVTLVVKRPTATTIRAQPITARKDHGVTFTATVKGADGSTKPVRGTVHIEGCGNHTLHEGTATCTRGFVRSGTHDVTATFESSPVARRSSATLTENVRP